LWEDNPTGLSQKKKKNPNEEYLNMYRRPTVKHFSGSLGLFLKQIICMVPYNINQDAITSEGKKFI